MILEIQFNFSFSSSASDVRRFASYAMPLLDRLEKLDRVDEMCVEREREMHTQESKSLFFVLQFSSCLLLFQVFFVLSSRVEFSLFLIIIHIRFLEIKEKRRKNWKTCVLDVRPNRLNPFTYFIACMLPSLSSP